MTDPSPEPTAEEQIDTQLASREATFKAWFVDEDDVQAMSEDDRKAVVDLAGQHGWLADDEPIDGESADERAERNVEDAARWVAQLRDEENKIDEQVLGFTIKTTVTVRVDLSWGGPGDWIDGEYDPSDGTLTDVKYHFAPWFDHAEVALASDSPLYRLLENFTSAYDGMELSDITGQ